MGNPSDNSEFRGSSASDASVAVFHAPNAHADLRPYDFRHPYRAAVYRACLNTVHTDFANGLSAGLSKRLGTTVGISLLRSDVMRYDEFLMSLDEVTCLSVLRVHPPQAEACLDLSLQAIHPMIDRLLGGSGDSLASHQPLTRIERNLGFQIVELAASTLAETWSRSIAAEVHAREMESNPIRVRIMPDNEIVTVVRFDVRVGSACGIMTLCLPAPVLEHLVHPKQLTSTNFRGENAAEVDRNNLMRNLLDTSIELRAMLATVTMRRSDVLTLQVGDILTTDVPADEAVIVQIDGANDMPARLGHFCGIRAVRIIDKISTDCPAREGHQ